MIDYLDQVDPAAAAPARQRYGWGTNLTNDFRGCAPFEGAGLAPMSLVCKVVSANGRPAVKLSDNRAKATGDPAAVARYGRIFGQAGRSAVAVRRNRAASDA